VKLKDQIIAALKKVYDPEMPVNIYELGHLRIPWTSRAG
jgi:metal-sulfur cluster biosynthetic enzyme